MTLLSPFRDRCDEALPLAVRACDIGGRMDRTFYLNPSGFDEMFQADGQPRPSNSQFVQRLDEFSQEDLLQRQKAAELSLHNLGITAIEHHLSHKLLHLAAQRPRQMLGADDLTGHDQHF